MKIPFSYDEIMHLFRLERVVFREALKLGFDGDPVADPMPQPKDEYDLHSAYRLLYKIPAKLRNRDREQALRMCRCAVWGRTRGVSSLEAMPTPDSTVDAKLQRERRRATA